MAGNYTALSRFRTRRVQDNLTKLYATNWAGLSLVAPSEVGAGNAVRFPGYAASTTNLAIGAVNTPMTFTLTVDKTFTAGDFIVAASSANPATKWVKGNVTAYTTGSPGSVTMNVQYTNGTGSVNDWTIGGTIPTARNYYGNTKFLGTDNETSFPLPTVAPFYTTGLSTTQFGINLIDHMDGFPSNDAAGFAASAGTTFEQVTINGATTTALVIDQTNPTAPIDYINGYRKQSWGMVYRDVANSGGVGGTDIPRLLTRYKLWVNALLITTGATADKFTTTNRRVTIWEMKTVTDFRYTVTIIYANSTDATTYSVPVGTIGWEIVVDNGGGEYVVSDFYRYKNYTTDVPQGEFFAFDVYWQRATEYTDLTTGRFLVRIKTAGATTWTTIADVNATTAGASNRHMGIADPSTINNKVQRIFFFGVYGKYGQTNMKIKCANLEFWNGLID